MRNILAPLFWFCGVIGRESDEVNLELSSHASLSDCKCEFSKLYTHQKFTHSCPEDATQKQELSTLYGASQGKLQEVTILEKFICKLMLCSQDVLCGVLLLSNWPIFFT